jgi:hypothetical protein
VDIDGTMNGSLTDDFNKIGRAGITIDIGKGKELGVSMTIEIGHHNRKEGN